MHNINNTAMSHDFSKTRHADATSNHTACAALLAPFQPVTQGGGCGGLSFAGFPDYLFASAVAHLLHGGAEPRGLADAWGPEQTKGNLGEFGRLSRRGHNHLCPTQIW